MQCDCTAGTNFYQLFITVYTTHVFHTVFGVKTLSVRSWLKWISEISQLKSERTFFCCFFYCTNSGNFFFFFFAAPCINTLHTAANALFLCTFYPSPPHLQALLFAIPWRGSWLRCTTAPAQPSRPPLFFFYSHLLQTPSAKVNYVPLFIFHFSFFCIWLSPAVSVLDHG